MDLGAAYDIIWRGKLEGQQPPEKQSIPRVNQAAELWRATLGDKLTGPLIDCGTGSGAMLAKARESGIDAIGVDFQGDLLYWLDSIGYRTASCDLNSGELPGENYQIAVSCDVVEHMIDPDHLLAEMHRVLAPKGLCLVSTPNASYWKRVSSLLAGEMFRTSGDQVLRDGGHLAYFGPLDLAAAMERAGFRDVSIHYFNHDPAPKSFPWAGEWLHHSYIVASGWK